MHTHFDKAMERKHEMRSDIKFCFKSGLNRAQTSISVSRAHPNASLATVQRWRKFEANPDLSARGKTRPGREKKRNPEKIEEVRELREENAKHWMRAIASQVNVSISSTHRILREDLGLS